MADAALTQALMEADSGFRAAKRRMNYLVQDREELKRENKLLEAQKQYLLDQLSDLIDHMALAQCMDRMPKDEPAASPTASSGGPE